MPTETEKQSNATDHIELNSGDDEQTSLPNPTMIGIAPPDKHANTILAHRFNVGDQVQVVKKGHKSGPLKNRQSAMHSSKTIIQMRRSE